MKHFENGNLVYHGYAAHLLMGKSIKILRVRINADKEYRIKGGMKDLNISRSEAIRGIDRVDRQNAKWAKALYGIDWNDPSLYDLVVNLQQISKESTVKTLAFMTTLDDFVETQALSGIDLIKAVRTSVHATSTSSHVAKRFSSDHSRAISGRE